MLEDGLMISLEDIQDLLEDSGKGLVQRTLHVTIAITLFSLVPILFILGIVGFVLEITSLQWLIAISAGVFFLALIISNKESRPRADLRILLTNMRDSFDFSTNQTLPNDHVFTAIKYKGSLYFSNIDIKSNTIHIFQWNTLWERKPKKRIHASKIDFDIKDIKDKLVESQSDLSLHKTSKYLLKNRYLMINGSIDNKPIQGYLRVSKLKKAEWVLHFWNTLFSLMVVPHKISQS